MALPAAKAAAAKADKHWMSRLYSLVEPAFVFIMIHTPTLSILFNALKPLFFYVILLLFIIVPHSKTAEYVLELAVQRETSQYVFETLKQNTQGFLLLVFVTLYFDLRRKKHFIPISKTQFTTMKEALRFSNDSSLFLKQLYHSDDVRNVKELIDPERPKYYDTDVIITLQDDPTDANKYLYKSRISFSADIDQYVIALVPNGSIADKLQNYRNVTSVTCFTSLAAEKEAIVERIMSGTRIYQTINKEAQTLTIKRTAKRLYSKWLNGLDKKTQSEIVLLHVDLQNVKGRKYLTIEKPFMPLPKDDHYAYWEADRPIFLKRITFNYTNFNSNRQKIRVRPYLINFSNPNDDEGGNEKVLDVNDWIFFGQGAMISWR